MPIRFRMRWVPLLATLVVVALGVSLGRWQTQRGDQKQEIQSRMQERQAAPALELDRESLQQDPRQREYRHVRLRGEFVATWTTYLDNRPYNGVAGRYVLTPFKIAGSERAVLVERGWVARDVADVAKLPAVPTPAGMIEIEGVLRLGAGHLLQLGAAAVPQPGALMQNLDIGAYAHASGLALAPFVIEQGADAHNAGDGLVRDWPAPSLGIERHRGYAVQWYALALMALIFFVVTGFRHGKK
jgi:surfeit locus 1 family protein